MNNAKITGNERDLMYKTIRCKLEEGHTAEHIITYINKKFHVNYKASTFKLLRKEAELQVRKPFAEQYMEKVKEEYQTQEAEDRLNSKEAERLFAIANREIDMEEI